MMMKCYLEIEVPVRYDALWFKELRDACKGVDVRWQRAWHHITMAFLDEMPAGVNFRGILDQHLKHYQAPELTFDKVDSFSTKSGMHIIYLSVTHVPKDFEAIVQAIRNDFETAGGQNAISLQITCHPRQSDRRGNQCPRLTTNHRLNPAPTIPPQTSKGQIQNIPRQNTSHHPPPPIVPEVWRIICRCRSGRRFRRGCRRWRFRL